jgi:CNT family concentrative nucleoside transporter
MEDEKNTSRPVEQYGVDPEKQSETVGSLHGRAEPEGPSWTERFPILAVCRRHWKPVAQLVLFMVFTASVPPR